MLINRAEFSVGQRITYQKNKKFFKATVRNVVLNPISNAIEYKLFYRTNNSNNGHHKIKAHPHEIKESFHFTGSTK
jgi:hypothetical protein